MGKGGKNMALIDGCCDAAWERRRCESFIATVEAGGGTVRRISQPGLMIENTTQCIDHIKMGKVIETMQKWRQRPDAVFMTVDLYVFVFYHMARHYGFSPGKNIEVIGCNNDSIFLNNLSPRPASVDIHPEKIGQLAVRQLLWRINNPKEKRVIIPVIPEIAFQ